MRDVNHRDDDKEQQQSRSFGGRGREGDGGGGGGTRKVGYCGTHPRVHFTFELSSLFDIRHSED